MATPNLRSPSDSEVFDTRRTLACGLAFIVPVVAFIIAELTAVRYFVRTIGADGGVRGEIVKQVMDPKPTG